MAPEISRRNVLIAAAAATATATHAVRWDGESAASAGHHSDDLEHHSRFGLKPLDTVILGDARSERRHQLSGTASAVIAGALGQSARVFNPLPNPQWFGGSVSVSVAVDPAETTYITVKLWGGDLAGADDDTQDWRLQLFVDGKSVGWYDEAPVDNLDLLGTEPRSPGRFFMHTLPLPEELTKGKTSLTVQLQSLGRIFSYGSDTNSFFYSQTTPSRGVYRVYSHTDPFFVPDRHDPMGAAPAAKTRPNTDTVTLAAIKAATLTHHQQLLNSNASTMDAWGFNELAEGYDWADSPAYRNPVALQQICAAIDGRYNAWKADETVLTASDQQWQGFGRVGLVLAYLWPDLQGELDKNVAGAGTPTSRRAAYREMLVASRDYWKQNSRHYTNQSQITAIGIYQANRGLSLLSPGDAWPESRARRWLHESIGLEPWLGSELPDGSRTEPLGDEYYVVTPKGLTRELGYVGNYGEVTDWLVMMYESITRGHGAVEAPELREQMLKIATVRGFFRHLDVDRDGYRIARLETVIGWRNEVYPGEAAYAGRTAWDSTPVMGAAAFNDNRLTGWAQQMLADGQFGPSLSLLETNSSNRVRLSSTRLLARDLPTLKAYPASSSRLPNGWDQPDYVFSDEVDGAVAIKNGHEVLFASLYWRARQAVNNWGRVHLLTPTAQRSATVREQTYGQLSAETFTVPDWVTWEYTINNSGIPTGIPEGGFPAPGPRVHQAYAGVVQRLARIPGDVHPELGSTDLGVEEVLVGIAPFYQLRYGQYFIAMNTTSHDHFTLHTGLHGTARNLTAKRRRTELSRPLPVPPMSTVVLHIDN